MTTHKVSLRAAPHKKNMLEKQMRYDILLNGEAVGELYYNMRGYCGYLPLPDGKKLDIGECSISAYRKEIARINREAREQNPNS